MSEASNRMAQALLQSQAVPPPPNPYALNEPLEQAVQPQSPPIHPIVDAIMRHMGLLSMIRNQRNQGIVNPEAPL